MPPACRSGRHRPTSPSNGSGGTWPPRTVEPDLSEPRSAQGTPGGASLRGKIVAIARVRAGGTMSVYPPGTITRCDHEVWVQTGRGVQNGFARVFFRKVL